MNFDFSVYLAVAKNRGVFIFGHCPLHDDRHPSFQGNTTTGWWKCLAGCGEGSMDDLERYLANPSAVNPHLPKTGAPLPKQKNDWSGYKRVAAYYYRDGGGNLRQRALRMEHPVQGKTFIQQHCGALLQWHNGASKESLAPYRHEIWACRSDEILFLVEGEKCVEHLEKLGFCATTTPGGATSWRAHYAPYFKDRSVVILPDNDEPGAMYAQTALEDIGKVAKTAVILNLADLEVSQDVVDWINKGNSGQDLNTLAIQALINPV